MDKSKSIAREVLRDLEEIGRLAGGKEAAIAKVQERIWSFDAESEDRLMEVLRRLAYDLDYYRQDPEERRLDPSYYGDERLIQEIAAWAAAIRRNM